MRLLLVFLKEPVPGKVKTRLAVDVGDENAARFYKAMAEVLLLQLQGLNDCRIRFCYTPDDAEEAIRFWLLPEMAAASGPSPGVYLTPSNQEVDFRPQGNGDLGERMIRAFGEGFADGFSEIAIIGTDCPDCGARWINAAFSRLTMETTRDAVIGPSTDGGYYFLALKSPAPLLFQNILWGSSEVLDATITSAVSANLTIEKLPELSDVDHLSDWHRVLESPLGAAIKKALGEPLSFFDKKLPPHDATFMTNPLEMDQST